MIRLIDVETDEDFEILSEILAKIRDGNVVCTLRQAVLGSDEHYNYVDLQKSVADSKATVMVNGDYCYITIQDSRRTDLHTIRTMYNTVLQRGTMKFKQAEANDYLLTVDVGYSDDRIGIVWLISAVQPIFASSDGDRDLTLVFSLENVRCEKSEYDVYDIDYELEVEKRSGDNIYQFNLNEEDVAEEAADEFDETEDIISTKDYTDVDV